MDLSGFMVVLDYAIRYVIQLMNKILESLGKDSLFTTTLPAEEPEQEQI